MKKFTVLVCLLAVLCTALAACGGKAETTVPPQTTEAVTTEAAATEAATTEAAAEPTETQTALPALEDGIYTAEFHTDSGMFHVNEAMEGKGTLTVQDKANVGDQVSVTATPDYGYKLVSIQVTDADGKQVSLFTKNT